MLRVRPCPICGDDDHSHERFPERLDSARITALSYASRKEPEFMNRRLVVCPQCELLYAPEIPSAGELERAYAETGYDSSLEAAHAAESYAAALRSRFPRLADHGAALEIVTGNGALLEDLRLLGFDPVIGIEPSRAAAECASRSVRDLIRVESFDPSRLPKAFFSLIVANQVLEHVEEPGQFLRAARELLAPGGTLMMVSHDYRHPLMRLLGRRSPIIDIEHLQIFSAASLAHALNLAGFAAIEVRSFANRYPLTYWVRLLPLPAQLKQPLQGWLQRGAGIRLGGLMIRARVGNFLAWAR